MKRVYVTVFVVLITALCDVSLRYLLTPPVGDEYGWGLLVLEWVDIWLGA